MVRGRPLKNPRFAFILFVGLHVLHCGLKCAGHGCVVCCWCYCVLMPSLRSISPLAATSRKRPQRGTRAWQAPHSKHAPAKPVLNMVCSYVRSLYVILMCVCVPLVGAPLIVCNLKAVRPSVSLTSRVCLTGHMSTNCRFPKHPHFAGAPPGTFRAARIFLSACLPGTVGFLMMLISCLLCQCLCLRWWLWL